MRFINQRTVERTVTIFMAETSVSVHEYNQGRKANSKFVFMGKDINNPEKEWGKVV